MLNCMAWAPGCRLRSSLGGGDPILTVWHMEHLLHGLPLAEMLGVALLLATVAKSEGKYDQDGVLPHPEEKRVVLSPLVTP